MEHLPCIHHVRNGLLHPVPNSPPFTLPQCQVLTISNASELPRWLRRKKESACQPRRPWRQGLEPWVGKIPWRRILATPCSILAWRIPWKRSLVGHSPCVAKSRTRVSTQTHLAHLDTQPLSRVSPQRWVCVQRGESPFPLKRRLPPSLHWLETKVGFLHSHGVNVAGGSGTLRGSLWGYCWRRKTWLQQGAALKKKRVSLCLSDSCI